ncbi:hypothetical protein NN561_014710 [Cricetulus griseus]
MLLQPLTPSPADSGWGTGSPPPAPPRSPETPREATAREEGRRDKGTTAVVARPRGAPSSPLPACRKVDGARGRRCPPLGRGRGQGYDKGVPTVTILVCPAGAVRIEGGSGGRVLLGGRPVLTPVSRPDVCRCGRCRGGDGGGGALEGRERTRAWGCARRRPGPRRQVDGGSGRAVEDAQCAAPRGPERSPFPTKISAALPSATNWVPLFHPAQAPNFEGVKTAFHGPNTTRSLGRDSDPDPCC